MAQFSSKLQQLFQEPGLVGESMGDDTSAFLLAFTSRSRPTPGAVEVARWGRR